MICDPTCFAARGELCSALMVNKCDGPACPFYKTQKQFQEDRWKAEKRLERISGKNPVGRASERKGRK